MSLFEKWQTLANQERTEAEYNAFWGEYLPAEQKIYEQILVDKGAVISGTVSDLAKKYGMEDVIFAGFLDGINTSLVTPVDLDALTEASALTLEIDLEKLYYNMLNAKADWLYELAAWDNNLTADRRKEIKKQFNRDHTVVKDAKIGRNDPCPCGSGKKYKHCCLNK